MRILTIAVFVAMSSAIHAAPVKWWTSAVESALDTALANRTEWQTALGDVKENQRPALAFLLEHMPERDLRSLKAEFILDNIALAYEAKDKVPWGKTIPDELFLNNVLPYANFDESRDPWRKDMLAICLPLIKNCKTPSEAVQLLNKDLFPKLNVKYSTQRKAPNQSPKESISTGLASCTGLSIILSDACRAVCIPTRIVGTPMWANKRGNHTWLEVWDQDWHFTGACEPDVLDKGWFVGDAAQAKKDVPEHAIYASSYARTKTHFPLVWAPKSKDVFAENVTDRYTRAGAIPADVARVFILVLDGRKKRIAVDVIVQEPLKKGDRRGRSKGETADTNDFLTFDLQASTEYVVKIGDLEQRFQTPKGGQTHKVEVVAK